MTRVRIQICFGMLVLCRLMLCTLLNKTAPGQIILKTYKRNTMAKKKNETTSAKVASKASKLLRDPRSSQDVRTVAASALTQKKDRRKLK